MARLWMVCTFAGRLKLRNMTITDLMFLNVTVSLCSSEAESLSLRNDSTESCFIAARPSIWLRLIVTHDIIRKKERWGPAWLYALYVH